MREPSGVFGSSGIAIAIGRSNSPPSGPTSNTDEVRLFGSGTPSRPTSSIVRLSAAGPAPAGASANGSAAHAAQVAPSLPAFDSPSQARHADARSAQPVSVRPSDVRLQPGKAAARSTSSDSHLPSTILAVEISHAPSEVPL